ncbi:DUF4382 domain-containing protein [Flavobacterium franklandianum]|uniref:DUF4382 domain-containing protein n=1 Tax=Flavobacterium franklandianum TaxID=2594430 RepID=A0A553CTQ6_9FLAO|nr:DUF4382 domain-containing protein [Flavobacterium franklandianum]TRX23841.1 DUF4382 domain-containing protein [Flavobacterium franklandianum]TRX27925.1 DUF4382 domain-containing protein [Flavobacterium franklandianum]
MKNIKVYVLSFLVIAFVSLFFSACNDDSSGSSQTSAIKVRLVDAPGDYKEVNIDVRDIMIKNSTNIDDQGWVSIGNTPSGGKIYNLLDLTGGVSLMLADTLIPSVYLGQVRLLLGDKNTVMLKDGTIMPLSTPSAQQSGLKLKVNQTLLGGVSYEFLMDFDVDHSVVKAGNSGNYNLHPVMRVTAAATSGVIKGTITNIAVAKQVLASVVVGTEIVSAYANAQGIFQLNGVPPGTYIVTLTPDVSSGLLIKTIPDVIVVNGAVKDMGSITL